MYVPLWQLCGPACDSRLLDVINRAELGRAVLAGGTRTSSFLAADHGNNLFYSFGESVAVNKQRLSCPRSHFLPRNGSACACNLVHNLLMGPFRIHRLCSRMASNILYAFFWVVLRRLNFICRRFGTTCSIFIGGCV
jgi:hypothetical protein